jgi:hypothetical protein
LVHANWDFGRSFPGTADPFNGLTLRQAALIAGFTYLLNPVTYAEYIYPKLVISGNAE